MLKKPRPRERGGAHEKIRAEKATRLRDERGAGGRKHPKSHAPKSEAGRRRKKVSKKPRDERVWWGVRAGNNEKSHAAERRAGRRRGKVKKSHATINSLNENSLDEEINNLLIRRDKQMSVYSRLRLQSEGQIAI